MNNVTEIYIDRVEEREATPDEIIARKELAEALKEKKAKEKSDSILKTEILTRLGLSADEAALLLS
jgi:hypothetical protein